jgi:hypothetical protein
MTDNQLNDKELDQLLAKASQPQIPTDFAERFASQIQSPQASNVIAFPQRKAAPAKPRFMLPMAAALAASLMLGVYAGASGQGISLFQTQANTALLGSANDFAPSGIEDLVSVSEDNKT